jgi:Zn ribbon nucleic-acid-binding protein
MDKLVVYNNGGKDYRECVACGYKEEMHFKPVARELETRVNQTEADKKDAVQVINILPFEKPDH